MAPYQSNLTLYVEEEFNRRHPTLSDEKKRVAQSLYKQDGLNVNSLMLQFINNGFTNEEISLALSLSSFSQQVIEQLNRQVTLLRGKQILDNYENIKEELDFSPPGLTIVQIMEALATAEVVLVIPPAMPRYDTTLLFTDVNTIELSNNTARIDAIRNLAYYGDVVAGVTQIIIWPEMLNQVNLMATLSYTKVTQIDCTLLLSRLNTYGSMLSTPSVTRTFQLPSNYMTTILAEYLKTYMYNLKISYKPCIFTQDNIAQLCNFKTFDAWSGFFTYLLYGYVNVDQLNTIPIIFIKNGDLGKISIGAYRVDQTFPATFSAREFLESLNLLRSNNTQISNDVSIIAEYPPALTQVLV